VQGLGEAIDPEGGDHELLEVRALPIGVHALA